MTAARWRPRLAETLDLIAAEAPRFKDDWWIIGSAAAALAGAEIVDVRDADLLLSESDAKGLIARWAEFLKTAPAPSEQFRSSVFARFDHAPLAIEAFGGFEMYVRGAWREIRPLTRVARGAVFTPSVAEQISILEAMDRDKDRMRIAALRARI